MTHSLIIYDIETGSLEDDAAIIQSSIRVINSDGDKIYTELHGLPEGYVQDTKSVATHGYADCELVGLALFQDSANYRRLKALLASFDNYVAGHNIMNFDNKFLARDGIVINAHIIDTLKVMRHSTRDRLDSYGLTYLLAHRKQAGDSDFLALRGKAHDAEFDVAICHQLISYLMSFGMDFAKMAAASLEPTYLSKLGFGKYGKYGEEGKKIGRAYTFDEVAKVDRQYFTNYLLGKRTIEWTKGYDGLFEAVQRALADVPAA